MHKPLNRAAGILGEARSGAKELLRQQQPLDYAEAEMYAAAISPEKDQSMPVALVWMALRRSVQPTTWSMPATGDTDRERCLATDFAHPRLESQVTVVKRPFL